MTSEIPPAIPAITGSEERWNAWIAKGDAHDRRLRRKLLIAVPTLCLVVALVILFLGPRL
jgi:hypothetical protein